MGDEEIFNLKIVGIFLFIEDDYIIGVLKVVLGLLEVVLFF